jgi:hypothetical protein
MRSHSASLLQPVSSKRKDSNARLLQRGAACRRQRTRPRLPSLARRRHTRAPIHLTRRKKGEAGEAYACAWGGLYLHLGGRWTVDISLNITCCKRMF